MPDNSPALVAMNSSFVMLVNSFTPELNIRFLEMKAQVFSLRTQNFPNRTCSSLTLLCTFLYVDAKWLGINLQVGVDKFSTKPNRMNFSCFLVTDTNASSAQCLSPPRRMWRLAFFYPSNQPQFIDALSTHLVFGITSCTVVLMTPASRRTNVLDRLDGVRLLLCRPPSNQASSWCSVVSCTPLVQRAACLTAIIVMFWLMERTWAATVSNILWVRSEHSFFQSGSDLKATLHARQHVSHRCHSE